ncbi:MAG: FAD-dependent oxidoreductase [Arthrobacter sp.]|uniref:FAD-dependent oxidoreductase n=1 Tax=unclassified Arthrobacter TaxID=235627 RepID=UPI002656B3EC|nr:FAD-dependent oxidoreductase [Micrococcaceae bacterium]
MDVVVIGAGLAGLHAAGLAAAQGHEVTVLEATSRVGGRVDTEVIDGFRCDRGFQLLNPRYPEARRALDLQALGLQAWGRGVAVRGDEGLRVLADPLRHPSRLRGLVSGLLAPRDLPAALRWVRKAGDDSLSLHESLDGAAFSTPLRGIMGLFFAGVLGDPDLEVSARFARRLAGYFAVGTPALPGQGMAAIAHQLATPLAGRIRYGHVAESLTRQTGRWTVSCGAGERFTADRVVVAAGPTASARLLGETAPPMHSLTTWWFSTEHQPSRLPFLHLDPRAGVRLAHTSVVSNVCPSYAPVGRHLVQATAVGAHGLDDESALNQAAAILGVQTPDWQLLVRHDIRDALPVISPGHAPPTSALDGVVLAGDQSEASIQGALASGAAAAATLGSGGPGSPAASKTPGTFEVRLRRPGDAATLWARLTDLDTHSAAIPFTNVTPRGARMSEGLAFVGLTRLGPFALSDRMLVRRAEAPTGNRRGRLAVSKFGPVAGEVEATVEQQGSDVEVVWRQSLRPSWLPRPLRPAAALVAKTAYAVGLRKLLA